MLGIRGAFVLLVLAPLVYGVYYPQPYLNQILRKVPIAVVDNDLSELSRQIVETLDASGAVQVTLRARTLEEARAARDRGEVFAVVGIPPGAERDMLKGTTVHLPVYADATYLFIFRSISEWHRYRDQYLVVTARRGRRSSRKQPRAGEARRTKPHRNSAAASVQSSGRLRKLRRASGLRPHSAANPADRCGNAHGNCADAASG